MRTPGQVGDSPGFRGIVGKIGGGRINTDEWATMFNEKFDPTASDYWEKWEAYMAKANPSYLGGHQGGPGSLLGFNYPGGSWADRTVEAFGGFHDFLNHLPFYNSNGTAHDFMPQWGKFGYYLGESISAMNVLIAAPVVAASIVPESARSALVCPGGANRCRP